jgi:Flp pilus assembly pilin Flp
MLGTVVKILTNEDGFSAIEYGLWAAFLMALAGQLATQFNLGQ